MANITEAEIRKIVENIINGRSAGAEKDFSSTQYCGRKLIGIYDDMNDAIDAAEKGRVYGLFGLQDKKVNCQPDFKKHYGKDNLILFQGEHYLNGQVLGAVVMPLVEKLLFGE